jgi:DNA modification methylase
MTKPAAAPAPSIPKEPVPTDDLTLDPTNANRGTERGRETVARSLEECGAGQSILADRNGTVIAGNKTLEAARKLGLPVRVVETAGDELLVVKRTDLALDEGDRARRPAYLDNRSSELGLEWDLEQLRADLAGGVDFSGCGFTDGELAALLAQIAPEPGRTDPDDVPEPPEEPVTRVGDLWLLGNHRLLCGDSTLATDVTRLMAGERAGLMPTDPPYLVDYDGGNHPQSYTTKGQKREEGTSTKHWDAYTDHEHAVGFYHDFLAAALAHALTDRPLIYQWFGMMRMDVVLEAWRATGLLPHQVIIWHKSRPVLARCDFMWDYEPCMYGWIQGQRPEPERRPPANARAVWDIDQREGIEDGAGRNHPTMKPVEVIRRPLEWHTKPGELIYEPFSGSGTAIIAAEMTGRRCYAIELSPVFVDVAVTRWQNFTGKEAERVEA